MKKIKFITTITLLLAYAQVQGQNLTIQIRQADGTFYSRINLEKMVNTKLGFTTGYNVDGRGLFHLEGTYSLSRVIKAKAGFAYHHHQDGFHPSFGLIVSKHTKKWEIDGHMRVLLNHLYHIGSEIEYLHKISEQSSLGLMSELEVGKEFMPLSEAKKLYIPKHPTYGTLLLGGPFFCYELTEKIDLTSFFVCGKKITTHENLFSYKIGLGIKYKFH